MRKSDAISRQELEQQQAKARAARAADAEIAQVQAQLDDNRHQRKKAEVLAQQTALSHNSVPKWAI